ncbi:mycothiol synthase [Nakamurella sp. YIM 132087]|uniref:Mycothiol acetyltransferase n=1 Tax=Nakamurella alba TaxID=2665158 RepID=A0A7K1FRX6_9ACTN|nr:mycothiol synthase [Nakamurella alba]MTD16109.1 mycothiol synthase [Nakamurella alba]
MNAPDDWSDGLSDHAATQVRALVADAAAVDGVAALGGHVLEALPHGRFLTITAGGGLSAVAVVQPGDPAELVVAPERRGQGLGRRLAAAAIAEAGGVWAHGDLPAAQAVATALGLVRTRELLQMRRPLAGSTALPLTLPEGITLRTFEPGRDEDAFLAVNGRAFAWHPEQGRLDRAGLAGEMAQDWFDPAGFFLAEKAGTVVGFHWTKVHPAEAGTPAAGEVYVIGVDPESGVRGLGRPLTLAGLRHLEGHGLQDVLLYVEGDNVPARKLYDALDFTVSRSDVVYRPITQD